jgi:predicted nucleic acid-binding protein
VVLVDTSVWIAVFRRDSTLALDRIIDFDDVVTCLPIVQEVLQGFQDPRAFSVARDAMYALPIVDSPMPQAVYDQAIDLYRAARRAGFTARSGVDCLIAASALRHHLEVLHDDRDYDALARVSSLQVRRLTAADRGKRRT